MRLLKMHTLGISIVASVNSNLEILDLWNNFQNQCIDKFLNYTCAKGDSRGLMPPSRSICAIVQAIRSSLR